MPNNDERKERLSELGLATLGVAATAVFFTRSQLGRNLASEGIARTRNALLKTSEQMHGKTLNSMWGHGASDIKKALKAFDTGLNDESVLTHRIPFRKNNFIAGLAQRKEMLEHGESYITRLFNQERMPEILNESLKRITHPQNEQAQRNNRQIIDDLMTHHDENISYTTTRDGYKIPHFTTRFEKKLDTFYGEKANQVKQALSYDLQNVEAHKERYKFEHGDSILKNIQEQYERFETYETRFKPNTFWNTLVGQQSATIQDILDHKEEFAEQKLGDTPIVNILQDLVNQDERFAHLIVDPALKIKEDKFYDYSSLSKAYDDAEDVFLSTVGRIIKPLEVHKHIKNSPDFFYIPKGMIDEKLQASMEPEKKELEHSYLRLFDKTYRIEEDGTLKHLEEIDNFYLTPARGFEGQQLRHMSGNVDYNLKDVAPLSEDADWFDKVLYRLRNDFNITGKVSKDFENEIRNAKRKNVILSKMGLAEEADFLGSYDYIQTGIAQASKENGYAPEVYEHIRDLIKDMDTDSNAFLPSLDGIAKIRDAIPLLNKQSNLNDILAGDEAVLKRLMQIDTTVGKNADLNSLAKAYQKNPIEALSRTFYHGKQKNNFVQEAKRELFKDALYASNTKNDLGTLLHQVENAGLTVSDLKRTKHMTALSYLQSSSYISIKAPDVTSSAQILQTYEDLSTLFLSQETKDMQAIYKRVSDENSIKHIAEIYKESFLQNNVSVANRPSPYVHMSKGINVLDIIESLNTDTVEAGEKAKKFFKQYIAGRNNMEDVTTQSLYPYFGLFRLQNDVKKVGANLGRKSMGNVIDLAKDIFTKRALPLYALGFGAAYLNYESENFFGQSLTNMAAEAAAKIDLGVRSAIDGLGLDGFLKDAHYWFTPLNYLEEEEYQTAEERKAFYESGYSPVKQSKFWSLGSSEFFGGKVLFYQPNYVKRSQVNWKDIGVYGSEEEKWKHSLIPTPRHPLSTIRYLMNPYWLEEKHKLDRPYMVSGPMFDPMTPWGAIGNLTVGRLIKPQKHLNNEFITSEGVDVRNIIANENARIMDEARNTGVISIKSSDTAIESAMTPTYTTNGSTGILSVVQSGNGGLGGYVARQDYKETYLNLSDKMRIFASSLQGGRDRILNQIERINYAIHEKAKWSYGNDTQFAKDIRNTHITNDTSLIRDRDIASDLRNLSSTEDSIKDLTYSIQQLSGIYSFLGDSLLPSTKRYAYARSSDMYATSNRFWESGVDGADVGGFMEIARRFIPHEDRNRIRVNPLRNNMPSWMPDRFKIGDPYTQVKKGEMRLPGAGYEALHGLEDKSNFKINSDFVGLDASSIINKTVSQNNASSDVISTYQESLITSGVAIAVNKGVYDESNNVAGAYDALVQDASGSEAVMQIKSLDEEAFSRLTTDGANREDLANVNYYVGQEGLNKGYMTYINSKTEEMMTFDINFSELLYQQSQAAVREARKVLTENVKKGLLSPFELYDDMTRFKILADVAPGSTEYKQYKKLIQSNLSGDAEKKEYEAILERVSRQSQTHRFFNYKFTHVNIDKINGTIESIDRNGIKLVGDDITYNLAGLKNYHDKIYDYLAPGMKVRMEYEKNYANSKYIQAAIYADGLNINRQMMRDGVERKDDGSAMATRALLTSNQILLGAPFEILSHLPIPVIHNKFLKANTPYESWMQENVYGSKFNTWDHPIQSILKPSFQQAWGSSLTQGLIGAGLFALNEYISDTDLSAGHKRAVRLAHLAFTPGAFTGEVIERVATLNPNLTKWSSGNGARIGSLIGLTGMALANTQNPFIASVSGAGIGGILGEWLEEGGGKRGALIGTAAGLAISAVKTNNFQAKEMFSEYIPEDTEKRWEIEEYFDRLEYLKYKGLYEKASRLAFDKEGVNIDKILSDMDQREQNAEKEIRRLNLARDNVRKSNLSDSTKYSLLSKISNEIGLYANPDIDVPATPYVRLAIGYKQAMKSTVYGINDTSSWAQMLTALEPYEREYFLEFAKETNPYKQKKILKSIAPYKRKILENAWGSKKKTKQESNFKYFLSHKLPNTFWSGWNANTSLDAYKVKTIENEGMMLSDFGYYDSEKDKPEVRAATPIAFDQENAFLMSANLTSVMNGLGITDSEISILPSQQSGIQTTLNLAMVNLQKFKNALSALGAQFY